MSYPNDPTLEVDFPTAIEDQTWAQIWVNEYPHDVKIMFAYIISDGKAIVPIEEIETECVLDWDLIEEQVKTEIEDRLSPTEVQFK